MVEGSLALCIAEDGDAFDSTTGSPATVAPQPVVTTPPSMVSTFPVNSFNNDEENEIPLIPFTPDNTDIDTINSFSSFNGINSINPKDVNIAALIEFFNNRRRGSVRKPSVSELNAMFNGREPGLVTARVIATTTTKPTTTTQPPPLTTTSPSTTPPPPTTSTTVPTTTTTTATTTTTTTTTTTPSTTTPTTTSTTTSSSPQGPATSRLAVSTNQVLQARTGSPATFRTRNPAALQTSNQQQFRQQQFVQQPQQQQQQEEAEFEPQEPQEAEFEPEEAQEQQEQENMFIPFHGEQPRTTDLMPFLNRAGVNTQVIRTVSLSSVQSIINSLPLGLKPIVLFRSGTGQLTELDAGTLLPVRRFGRSTTTTRGPKKVPGVLLTCDLDVSPCEVTPVGGNWTLGDSPTEGRYTEGVLDEGEGSQIVFQRLVSAPSTEGICIAISHRRSLLEGVRPNATIPELLVGVMPLGGEVIRKSVGGASGMWEISRVSISKIQTPFLVVMTIAPASDPVAVALDALQITDGLCCLSGVC